jgi:hypothetical protein
MSEGYAVSSAEGIAAYQLCRLKAALKLELLGMRHSSGKTAYAELKRYGYKGSRQRVLEQVTADVESRTVPAVLLDAIKRMRGEA